MCYPKNDHHFQTFIIGRVEDHASYWKIHAARGVHSIICDKTSGLPTPKAGGSYRIYDQDGNERGCYINGRKLFYRTTTQHRLWIRQTFTKNGLRIVDTNTNRRRTNP